MPNSIKVLGKTCPVNRFCIWFIPVLSIFDTGAVSEMDFSKGPSLGKAMTVMPNHSFISIQISLLRFVLVAARCARAAGGCRGSRRCAWALAAARRGEQHGACRIHLEQKEPLSKPPKGFHFKLWGPIKLTSGVLVEYYNFSAAV